MVEERDDIARYLMGEFLGVTWGRAYAAADAVIGLRREAERPKADIGPEFSEALAIVEHHGDGQGEGPSSGEIDTVFGAYAAMCAKLYKLIGNPGTTKPAPPLEAIETVKAFAEPFMKQFYRDDWSYVREALAEIEAYVRETSR